MAASAAWARLNKDSINTDASIPARNDVIPDANNYHVAGIRNNNNQQGAS
jgi:hypothetical protein